MTQLLGGSGDPGAEALRRGRRRHQALRRAQLLPHARRAACAPRTASRPPISASSSASSSSRRSATATATASRTTSTSAPTSRRTSTASRTTTAAPIRTTTTTASSTSTTTARTTPRTCDGVEDEDGCPEGVDGDRDGDGILDSQGQVPRRSGRPRRLPGRRRLPRSGQRQGRHPDKKDQCPNDPEDKDGFEDEDGCPDPDNDKDGIPDVKDKCPNEPETFNGFEDEDGCPDKGNVIIQDNNILILQKVHLQDGQRRDPAGVERHPRRGRHDAHPPPRVHAARSAGHADERPTTTTTCSSPRTARTRWSKRSSQRGVAARSPASQGYGEYCPLDGGHNEAAWEKNRRVEFKVVKTQDGADRRRARLQASSRQGRDPGCRAVRAPGRRPRGSLLGGRFCAVPRGASRSRPAVDSPAGRDPRRASALAAALERRVQRSVSSSARTPRAAPTCRSSRTSAWSSRAISRRCSS